MNDETQLLLRTVSLFTEIPKKSLDVLAAHLTEIRVLANGVVVQKGDAGSCLYIVAQGRLQARDGERVLNEIHPRDVFGEMSVLDSAPRSATVVALDDSTLLKLDQKDLYELIAHEPHVARSLVQLLSRRLRARMKDMADDYEYMQQFAKVTAAAVAIEAGVYEPQQLDGVAQRADDLGQLARVFQRAIKEVYAREQLLRQQVAELKIEIDQTRQSKQVAEITETDYFKQLRQKASRLRQGEPPRQTGEV